MTALYQQCFRPLYLRGCWQCVNHQHRHHNQRYREDQNYASHIFTSFPHIACVVSRHAKQVGCLMQPQKQGGCTVASSLYSPTIADKGSSRKLISTILHNPAPVRAEDGLFARSGAQGRPQDVGGANKYAGPWFMVNYGDRNARWYEDHLMERRKPGRKVQQASKRIGDIAVVVEPIQVRAVPVAALAGRCQRASRRALLRPRRCCSAWSRTSGSLPCSSASILACSRLSSCVVAFSICVLVSILAALMSCVLHARACRTQDKSWIVGDLPLDLPALRDG